MSTPKSTTTAPALLTVEDVCAQLGVPRSTYYKWNSLGIGPRRSRMPNGAMRTRQVWLDDFIMSLEVGA